MRYYFDSMFYSHDNNELPLAGAQNRAVVFNELRILLIRFVPENCYFMHSDI